MKILGFLLLLIGAGFVIVTVTYGTPDIVEKTNFELAAQLTSSNEEAAAALMSLYERTGRWPGSVDRSAEYEARREAEAIKSAREHYELIYGISAGVLGVVGLILLAVPTGSARAQPSYARAVVPSKSCPFCAETIRKEAMVCHFCARDLMPRRTGHASSVDQLPASLAPSAQPPGQEPKRVSMGGPAELTTPKGRTDEAPSIYLWLHEQQTGPYTVMQVMNMLTHGEILTDTLIWSEGMADWQPISATNLQG